MTSVYFNDSEAHSGTPYSTFTLLAPFGVSGPKGSTVSHSAAIVDTGAGVCQFPEELAQDIGVDPTQGAPVTLVTAGGAANRRRLVVDVELFGVAMTLDVDFGANAQPLIGRNGIEQALKTLGYTTADLLYET